MDPQPTDRNAAFSTPARRAWGAWTYFLALFIPLVLIIALVLFSLHSFDWRAQTLLAESAEKHDLAATRTTVLNDLRQAVWDMEFLARQSDLQRLLAGGQPEAREALARDFLAFCETRALYDQVYFINLSGEEIVRVAFQGGRSAIVGWDDLQNRSGEAFIRNALRLPRGGIGFALMQKDAEGGERSALRIAAPVFDATGKHRGIVVTHYLLGAMLQAIKVEKQCLVDAETRRLYGGRREAMGGLIPADASSEKQTAAWERIRRDENGQFRDLGALFTFTTIRVPEDVAAEGAARPPEGSAAFPKIVWRLVSRVPADPLFSAHRWLRAGQIWLYAVLLTTAAAAAWPYARLLVRRREWQERIHEYAATDTLTQLQSRRFGLESLDRLLRECRRLSARLTVIMVDVNGLKQINDRFGHTTGDAALQRIASALRGGLREVDVVCRFGGDEFLIVLPFTSLDHAQTALDRIKQGLLTMDMSAFAPFRLDFSFGGAEYDPVQNQSVKQLLEAADEIMYERKRLAKAQQAAPQTPAPDAA